MFVDGLRGTARGPDAVIYEERPLYPASLTTPRVLGSLARAWTEGPLMVDAVIASGTGGPGRSPRAQVSPAVGLASFLAVPIAPSPPPQVLWEITGQGAGVCLLESYGARKWGLAGG